MQVIKYFLLIILMCSTIGCMNSNNNTPIIRTEYVRVEVPVRYKLERPARPKLTKDKSSSSYLSEVLSYTELLEIIIDRTSNNITDKLNKGINE